MVAKSGDPLLPPDARRALVEHILPLALVVTPNLPEAERADRLSRHRPRPSMEAAARRIGELGPSHVLVKGGHLKGDPMTSSGTDTCSGSSAATRIDSPNTHGTGCTLSAGSPPAWPSGTPDRRHPRAKAYVTRAILEGFARPDTASASSGTSWRSGDDVDEGKMSFLDHLGELRTRIVWSLIPTAVGLVVAFPSRPIMQFIQRPLDRANVQLGLAHPHRGLLDHMKIAMVDGGASRHAGGPLERLGLRRPGAAQARAASSPAPFVIIGSVLFLLGAAFALLVVMPFALDVPAELHARTRGSSP